MFWNTESIYSLINVCKLEKKAEWMRDSWYGGIHYYTVQEGMKKNLCSFNEKKREWNSNVVVINR